MTEIFFLVGVVSAKVYFIHLSDSAVIAKKLPQLCVVFHKVACRYTEPRAEFISEESLPKSLGVTPS